MKEICKIITSKQEFYLLYFFLVLYKILYSFYFQKNTQNIKVQLIIVCKKYFYKIPTKSHATFSNMFYFIYTLSIILEMP